jgi:uncharacterized membrane protein YhaH (DUF805 family)
MQWFTDVITKRYAQFDGRARRKEFWLFILISWVISIALSLIDRLIGLTFGGAYEVGILSSIFGLAVLVPTIAVAVRRMHDTNRSGWWVALNFLCCIGTIIFIVFAAQEGTVGDNPHGPDPKAAERGPGFGGPGGPAEPGYPTV